MEITARLALLLLTLLLASASANAFQGRGRGLNTREFDTKTPAEKQDGRLPPEAELCLGGTGMGGSGATGGSAAGTGRVFATPCPPYESAPAWYLSFYDFDLLEVSDSKGHTDRLYEQEVMLKTVDDASYDALCPERLCVMVIVSTGQSFTFKFKSTGRPMRLDLVRGVGNTHPDVAVRYRDLNLPRGTWALLKLTPAGLEDLRVDADGDGNFETTVRPTGSASGPSARDTGSPDISVDVAARAAGSVLVTLHAEDPSGVGRFLYSLDGTHFKPYTGPFEVDPARVREVWAFADDKLGNRSAPYVFDVRTGQRRPLP